MIQELREHTLTHENTAQTKLFDNLDALIPTIDELVIDEPLYGDLDLEVIEKCDFKNITSIRFAPGHITSIQNIPKTIRRFICPRNLLTHLDALPPSIEILEIAENAIHHIDLAPLAKLQTLDIRGNRFEVLENLPKSLESILCDNNQIRRINLAHIVGLKTLHCSNNGLMYIENMPDTVTDFEMENNPLLDIRYKTNNMFEKAHTHNTHEIEYTDAIYQYYKWKTEYETKSHLQKKHLFDRVKEKRGIKRAKREVQQIKPVCILCKRPVGMVFTRKENHLIGQCGDANHRCLDVKLYTGEHMSLLNLIDEYKFVEEYEKQNIIALKYNTLFNYMTEAESVKEFKLKLEVYNGSLDMLKEFQSKYEELYFNADKKLIREKKYAEIGEIREKIRELYQQYLKEGNRDILATAMEIHHKELLPILESMRYLKYNIVEMDLYDNMHILVQKPIGIRDIDYTVGEMPKVVTWIKKEGIVKDVVKDVVKYAVDDVSDEDLYDYLK